MKDLKRKPRETGRRDRKTESEGICVFYFQRVLPMVSQKGLYQHVARPGVSSEKDEKPPTLEMRKRNCVLIRHLRIFRKNVDLDWKWRFFLPCESVVVSAFPQDPP